MILNLAKILCGGLNVKTITFIAHIPMQYIVLVKKLDLNKTVDLQLSVN